MGRPERIEPLAPLRADPRGVVRVGGTRVTLDSILHAYRRGDTPEEIAEGFPTVALADIYATIAYYLRYPDEVEAYPKEQKTAGEQVRREIEEQFPATELRKKLRGLRKRS